MESMWRLPGAAGAGLVEVLVLALVTVVARLVALPAVADISVVVGCLLPAQAVSPRPRLSLQFPAEHFVHIYRGQSPGEGRGQIFCYGESNSEVCTYSLMTS